MLIFLNFLSLCVFQLATYFVWLNKKNVFSFYNIGFCIVAYLIPYMILDLSYFVSNQTLSLYYLINVCGVLFFLLGLYIGSKWRQIKLIDSVLIFSSISSLNTSQAFINLVIKYSIFIYISCLIIMVFCFAYMGYIPMFASDPYAAKQFKGIYQPRYQHVAIFYRTAKQFVQILLPFLIIDYYFKKKSFILLLIIIGVSLVFVSLSRGDTVTSLLLSAAIIISMKKGKMIFGFYVVLVILIFSLGSSFWAIISYFLPKSGFASFDSDQTIAGMIASGAPDMYDHVIFLEKFQQLDKPFTYGLTFIGGLIPFNFKYSPSSWTLYILNDSGDISETVSGGLRLPVSIWGYVSFGWLGTCLVPFISAFFLSYIVKKFRNLILLLKNNHSGCIVFYFITFLFLNIAIIFYEFYKISIYLFPAFLFYVFLLKQLKQKQII